MDEHRCCVCEVDLPPGTVMWTVSVSRERVDPGSPCGAIDVLWDQTVKTFCEPCGKTHNLFGLTVPKGEPAAVCQAQYESDDDRVEPAVCSGRPASLSPFRCSVCEIRLPPGTVMWTVNALRERVDPSSSSVMIDVLWASEVKAFCGPCSRAHDLLGLTVPKGAPAEICPAQYEPTGDEEWADDKDQPAGDDVPY